MLPLGLTAPSGRPLSVLAVGAHPDDIEIGARRRCCCRWPGPSPGWPVHYVVLTGTPAPARRGPGRGGGLRARRRAQHQPARPAGRAAARELGPGQGPDRGAGPARRARPGARAVAATTRTRITGPSARSCRPCSATRSSSATRSPSGTATSAGRRCTSRCPTESRSARSNCCTSASRRSGDRDWWDDEVFLGLARLRGMECRSRYAEAFRCTKAVLGGPLLAPPPDPGKDGW